MKRRTKISLTVVAASIGFSLWQLLNEDYGVGVDSVSWLPPEAHNIAYRDDSLTRTAEFDIEREEFERWCRSRNKPLRKLSDGERHTIFRCLPILERKGLIPAISEPNKAERDLLEVERAIKSFVGGDLFYEERWDNGGGYTVGYDVKEKKGYYAYSHH